MKLRFKEFFTKLIDRSVYESLKPLYYLLNGFTHAKLLVFLQLSRSTTQEMRFSVKLHAGMGDYFNKINILPTSFYRTPATDSLSSYAVT